MSWKEFTLQILSWCGQQSTLIVAIIGFVTSILIARLNRNLALEQEILRRWLDAHEKAIRQLWRTIETYDASVKALKLVANGQAMEVQLSFLVACLQQLIGLEKGDDDLFGAILFSKNGLTYDNQEVLSKMTILLAKINDSATHINEEGHCILDFTDELQQLATTMEKRQNFLIRVYDLWMQRFRQHPRVKKWIDKGV